MGFKILSVATEWFSFHGGLSTFNRSFCAALAADGHEVYCLVPKADPKEVNDAKHRNVELISPDLVPGLTDDALLCLPTKRNILPDVVVGHGLKTGGAAAARIAHFYPGARRIHIFHTLPQEIEPFKDGREGDSESRAKIKQQLETELAVKSDLMVAVGPRLYRQWSTLIADKAVLRLTPGLPRYGIGDRIPLSNWCLLFGRLEDAKLKGVDLAAAALGTVAQDQHFVGSKEVTLVLRGAEAGKSDQIREFVMKSGGAGVSCHVVSYTHNEEELQKDIARSSLVLMPSRMEGFGLVGFEALAMGVPVLISQKSGLAELLQELIDVSPSLEFAKRFIVNVGDEENDRYVWAKAISEILRDRPTAFKQAKILRDALVNKDYWRRAISDIFAELRLAEGNANGNKAATEDGERESPGFTSEKKRLVGTASLIELAIEEAAKSIMLLGPTILPPLSLLYALRKRGLIDSKDLKAGHNLLHKKNQAIHDFGFQMSADEYDETTKIAKTLLKKLESKSQR